jgi:RNA polymerase sigma factor (TIGR02999 family)
MNPATMSDPLRRTHTTQLLISAREGSEAARAALFERLYEPLRELARRQLRRGAGGAIDTTELVHEAYLKLCDPAHLTAHDRVHFMALSARVMRQILVDHFRSRSAGKRGGRLAPLPLDEGAIPVDDRGEVVLVLDQALERLRRLSARAERVVELKFFGGMTEAEIATALEVSVRTVNGEWRKARAWLARELAAD